MITCETLEAPPLRTKSLAASPPREWAMMIAFEAPVSVSTRSTSAARWVACSAELLLPAMGTPSSARARGLGTSTAKSRSRGQPFDSKRHIVGIHPAAFPKAPWMKTIGGCADVRLSGGVAQAPSNSAAKSQTKGRQHMGPPWLLVLGGIYS